MPKAPTVQNIIKKAKGYLPHLKEERILQAYSLAEQAHGDQKRDSGKPYITHPLAVTNILLTLKPDEDSIVASLLHDVLEDTDVPIDELEKKFGKSVMPLLKGLEKLSTVYYRGRERQVENLRKMFLAMAQDIRVILIKLCDRLHNMRTLQHIRKDKQKRIAEETLMVYAPIAARLGIYEIKNELDELGFKYANPTEHRRISKGLEKSTGLQQNIIKVSKRILKKALKDAGIEGEIEGRIKNPFSVYKKLRRKDKNYVNELYDILAMRIVVADEPTCYQTLGVLHKNWTPLSRRFKDYIGRPKPNGYQSLHTTLIGLCPDLHNQPIEVQIRSKEMDEIAKYGIASHWQYQEEGGKSVLVSDDKLMWVQSLVELHENLKSNVEFIDSLSVDIFKDRIFVLTPHGDVKDLPFNATPVDLAYAVHTEVGHKCKGAKVNGKIVPLDYKLKNGQVVEILTKNQEQPNRYWLSFVVTSAAKQKIKQWFNLQDRGKLIRMGKEFVNVQLKRFNQPQLDPSLSIFKTIDRKKLSLREREALLEKIGNGSVNANTIIRKVLPVEKIMKPISKPQKDQEVLSQVTLEKKPEILITGEKGIKTNLATCCKPRTSDEIIGYITRGRGVTIHKKGCKVLRGNDVKRLVKASWSTKKTREFVMQIIIKRNSRIGLLRDVAARFAENELGIIDIHNIQEGENKNNMVIKFSIDNLDTLDRLIDGLEQIPGVTSVKEFTQ